MTDSKTIDDGGFAFPLAVTSETTDTHGMSLRDYFAAKAMNGQLSGFWTSDTPHGWSFQEIAREAYAVADAMIAARKGGAS